MRKNKLIEYLKTIDIKFLLRCGIIYPTIVRDIDVYEKYQSYMEQGAASRNAALWTGDIFGISERQVFNILKKFRCD